MAELNIVEKVIALEGVDLLSGLAPDQLARIASIASEVRVAPGKVVLDPAKPLDALFVVLDGGVSLAKDGAEIHVARQNEVLGAWALFDNEPMPVTATAAEESAAAAHQPRRFLRTAFGQCGDHCNRVSAPW